MAVVVAALLVPAVLLTAGRTLNPHGLRWVQIVAFTPYAAPLYASALLLLLVVASRGRGTWRDVTRALAGLALVGAVVHCYWARAPFVGRVAADEVGRATMIVMTSNLLAGGADTTRVVELATARDVDVLVVQEVTPRALAELERAGVGRLLPHTVGKPERGVAGTMVFSRAPLSGVRRLGTGFAGFAMTFPMGASDAGTGMVELLDVHPRAPTDSLAKWQDDHRVVGRAVRRLSGPAMVVGDLHATMDHAELRGLERRGYEDAATSAGSGFQPTWPSSEQVSWFGVAVPPLIAIDHVLVAGGLQAVRTDTFEVEGTDHRALVVTLDVTRAARRAGWGDGPRPRT